MTLNVEFNCTKTLALVFCNALTNSINIILLVNAIVILSIIVARFYITNFYLETRIQKFPEESKFRALFKYLL